MPTEPLHLKPTTLPTLMEQADEIQQANDCTLQWHGNPATGVYTGFRVYDRATGTLIGIVGEVS